MENVNASFDEDEFKKQQIIPSNYNSQNPLDKTLTKMKVEVTVKVLLKVLAVHESLTVSRYKCRHFDCSFPLLNVARPFEQPCRSSKRVALLKMQRPTVVQSCFAKSHYGRFGLKMI